MRRPPICFIWTLLSLYTYSSHAQQLSAADISRCEAQARQVQIIRDNWGVPHIYGKTDADAVFGLMYAECEEDFSRMEKNYLEVMGRQAEAYGESYLRNDVQMRLIYDSAQAVADYQHSPVWMRKLLDAFADGVNYYLYKHTDVRPLVLHHWQPWYALMFTDGSVAATSTGGVTADETWAFYNKHKVQAVVKPKKTRPVSDVEKMILEDRGILPPKQEPEDPGPGDREPGLKRLEDQGTGGPSPGMSPGSRGVPDDVDAGPDRGGDADRGVYAGRGADGDRGVDADRGSNGFAIAPARTANGNALLYINPHVPYYFRMEVHLVSEEGLNTYGAVTWGQFFVYQGFNEHCGWMHTSSYSDVADLYSEQVINDGESWTYQYEGKSKPIVVRPFTVLYKKDAQVLKQEVTGVFTAHGPVVAEWDGKWLSLKEYNRSLSALEEAWLITKARTFAAYKEAMNLRANTTNNTVYADDQGNIAYWHGNFMPRRDTTYDWSRPVDGSIAATEWNGLHELDEIVHVYNPSSGWIQNCNSTPYSLSGSSSPRRQDYPYYMAPDGENFRALNAARLLGDIHHMTLDSLIAKGYDTYLTAFDVMLPVLLSSYETVGDSLKQALAGPVDVLKQWDRRSSVHSVATSLAIEWGMAMMKYAPAAKLPEDGSYAVRNVTAEMRNATAEEQVRELLSVVVSLQQRFGSWKVEWGELCRYQRLTGKINETYDDAQASLPVGLTSSLFGALPSVQSRVMASTKKRYAYSGNSFIAAVEFGRKLHAKSIVTGGESSNPSSPHFSDQAEGLLNGKFKDVLFYKEDVMKHVERKYHPGEE